MVALVPMVPLNAIGLPKAPMVNLERTHCLSSNAIKLQEVKYIHTGNPVGLDRKKRIFSEKSVKRGGREEAKRWRKEAKLMSYGHIKDDEFRIILNDHALLLLAIVYLRNFGFINSKESSEIKSTLINEQPPDKKKEFQHCHSSHMRLINFNYNKLVINVQIYFKC